MKKKLSLLMFIAVAFVLTACGGDESDDNTTEVITGNGESSSSNEVNITASDWDFDQDTYVVEAGETTVNLSNEEGYHGISIDGTDLEIEGDGSEIVDLEPGEYRIWCNIPCGEGHADMEATLVVE